MSTTISVIPGDGIGPEIMDATLRVLDALDAGFKYEFVAAGLAALEQGGELLPQETLDSITRNRVLLKGPLTTPVGKGFRSLNVTLRREFDLYANVRPVVSMPGTRSHFVGVDLITVRENTEGAYLAADAAISEDGQTASSKMVVTREGCARISRYAYELARREQRSKVTIVHKANILKHVSGMFLDVAREVARNYPGIETEEMIVDATCMKLVMNPWQFDVIVTTNLFGDIISDLCAGLVGGLGLAPGANIGDQASMFEAVHGSAPDIAGQKIANPCALMLAAAQMLAHLGMEPRARRLRTAIRDTLKKGDLERMTPDVGGHGTTGTMTDAIVEQIARGRRADDT
jgi:isocitrate dehydrogenase (NAD+)